MYTESPDPEDDVSRVGAAPEPSRPPVVATIGMATLDYLYLLEDHPTADSVNPALEYHTVWGAAAGAADRREETGARPGFGDVAGTGVHAEARRACMPRSVDARGSP